MKKKKQRYDEADDQDEPETNKEPESGQSNSSSNKGGGPTQQPLKRGQKVTVKYP